MADMDRIAELAARHGLKVIEDCAHMHGGFWRGRGVGSIGGLGCFSFQSTKLMSSGEGGIIITSDEELARRCHAYVDCGRLRPGDKPATSEGVFGWNYRMTEFQAAVLLAQLERLPEQVARRDRNVAHLERRIAEIEGVSTLRRDPRQETKSGYGVVLRYDEAIG